MSKYTTEVRWICESYAGLDENGADSVEAIIKAAIPKIFNFNFPIFDEKYREVLCTKILMHFYTREIGYETVGLWKLKLNTKLNEIMPYYNQLYKSELLEFNPLYDIDVTREHTLNRTGNTASDNTTNSNNTNTVDGKNSGRELFSNTPQGGIDGMDLVDDTYLTNATLTSQETDVTTTDTNTSASTYDESTSSEDNFFETVKGKNGGVSYSKMLSDFRQTFLNVDAMIIEELNNLFMNIW